MASAQEVVNSLYSTWLEYKNNNDEINRKKTCMTAIALCPLLFRSEPSIVSQKNNKFLLESLFCKNYEFVIDMISEYELLQSDEDYVNKLKEE